MPVHVLKVSTRQPDVAYSVLKDLYCPHQRLTLATASPTFLCDLRATNAGDLGADTVRLSTGVQCTVAPVDYLLVTTGVVGTGRYDVGGDEVRIGAGSVFRFPDDDPLTATWDGIELLVLRLPRSVVGRVASERLPLDARDVRFGGLEPVSAAAGRAWVRLAHFVAGQLADDAPSAANPIAAAALADLVAAGALATFPNTTLDSALVRGPGYAAPSTVRRAVAFIDDHASLPVTVTDIAHAAGVSARALQSAFQRHLGVTPMAYLRRARLEGAHRDLQAADPTAGDTVADVALRWGFVKTDRFAAAYRQAFGVPPSRTLRG
ncbi:AraC family transcriptional regulator [Cellulomonas algicola]|uniref:AraC family transcriptional regulator n=1 Tax=Cellulomonas algicola TaxID=2071633 RepID=UPI001C3F5CEC|nr:AraC family transcriptional regulator [Cellulomonas algicola]